MTQDANRLRWHSGIIHLGLEPPNALPVHLPAPTCIQQSQNAVLTPTEETMHREQSHRYAAIRCPLSAAIALLGSCLAPGIQADPAILEEIIVTSQKREQSLQEVPLSVAAVTGEKIEKMGVENLEDLTSYVPNIHFTETGMSTQMRIRGIGSDNSQGFEQSVGVYKDGIYHSRAQLFRAPIFDVERAEVMRGPQGTLFGKNSIAGAIDLITAKPTDELRGKISASYEDEFGTEEFSGFISGPLSETVKGRLALRYYEDPGFMVNTFKNKDEAESIELSGRASLLWQPSNSLDVLWIVEHNSFDTEGRAIEITQDLQAQAGPYAGLTYSQILAFANGGVTFDSNQDFRRQIDAPEYSDNEVDTQTLRIDYELPGVTLTSLTGYLRFQYDEHCDCDFTPANIFDLHIQEKYEQISQEFRITSQGTETFEWLAGIFYQTYDQSFNDDFNLPANSVLNPITGGAIPAAFFGTGIDRDFTQKSDVWAIFAEFTWSITDTVKLNLGGRYTEEDKEATKTLNIVGVENPADLPVVAAIYAGPNFATDTVQHPRGHNLAASRNESSFTPSATLSYQANDDVMGYLRWSKGFKAGGFDPRSNNRDRFEFDEEKVTAIELGSKMRLAGGRSELNVAIFHMDYEDLQVSQFDGAVGFNIGNAKSTIVQGIEMDGRWQLSSSWSGSYGVAVLDFEYEDFTNGNCHFGQPADANGFCDYTGKRGVYTPELTVNLGIDYSQPIGNLWFNASLDAQWVDEQQVHVNLDPHGEVDAFTLVDMRLALEGDNWTLALLGKNLLNEEIIAYSANMPLSESLLGTNTFYSFLRRPRTLALEGTIRF
jgi:iron complex outermembrane receptor protein